MFCYTFHHGELTRGIQAIEHDGRMVVFGGEEGPGRRSFQMRMHNTTDKFQAPEIVSGVILKAYPRRISDKHVVLAKPTYKFRSKKFVVRIYTGSSVGGNLGSWTILEKTKEMKKVNGVDMTIEYPLQLAIGWGGFGEYARVSRWYDGMFVLAPSNAISIRCEDGTEKVLVNVDGRLDLLSQSEHMMFAASRSKIEQISGPVNIESESAKSEPESEIEMTIESKNVDSTVEVSSENE